MNMKAIWEKLTHDAVIDCVEKAAGKKLTGLCIKRNSYINRVFELEDSSTGQRYIAKFYRPGRWGQEMVQEEQDLVFHLKELDLPVIPPLKNGERSLFEFEGISFTLSPRMGGRALDEFSDQRWEEIGRIIGRMHLATEKRSSSLRAVWSPKKATAVHLKTLLDGRTVLPDFEKPLEKAAAAFIEAFEPLFKNTAVFLLHGDIHRGNFIHRPQEGIYVVDFDDICVGPSVQDLWMLLPDKEDRCKREIELFLKGYQTFRKFDLSELELIPALRIMRMVHFAAWCSVQKGEPHFEQSFPEWGKPKYWNELIRDINSLIFREE